MSACVYVLKEAMQQWYHHYQAAQAHTYSAAAPQDGTATEYSKEHTQVPASCSISLLTLNLSVVKSSKPVGTALWLFVRSVVFRTA